MEKYKTTGGPFTVHRWSGPIELNVSLEWAWQNGEPGSLSVPAGWFLYSIEAKDKDGERYELTPDEEDDAANEYAP